MSVIFKSLQMLRDRSRRRRATDSDLGDKQRRFLAFRRLSPGKRIGIIVAILFILGGGVSLSLQRIKEYIYSKNIRIKVLGSKEEAKKLEKRLPPHIIYNNETTETAKTPPSPSDITTDMGRKPSNLPPSPEIAASGIKEPKDLPPIQRAPETEVKGGTKPAGVSLPPTIDTAPKITEVKEDSIRYLPPSPPQEDRVVIDKTIPEDRNKELAVKETIVKPEGGDQGMRVATISPPGPSSGPETRKIAPTDSLPEVRVEDRSKIKADRDNKIVSLTLQNAPVPDRAGVVGSEDSQGQSPPKERKPNNNAAIGYLVGKIENSIAHGNSAKTKKLIDKLGRIKGEDNDYVLKLRAYWNLSAGNDDTASYFLQKVLSRNEDDLEAGINMAILELKTNQAAKGKKRLKKLREIYPDNQTILDLLRKIET